MQNTDNKKRIAVVLLINEIMLDGVTKALREAGYGVRRDVESSKEADIGFICSYFASLGGANQLRAVNPCLPLVLIVNAEHELKAGSEGAKGFYDVIPFDSNNDSEIHEKISKWFSEGRGKFLVG